VTYDEQIAEAESLAIEAVRKELSESYTDEEIDSWFHTPLYGETPMESIKNGRGRFLYSKIKELIENRRVNV
jgi:hypothetical protein